MKTTERAPNHSWFPLALFLLFLALRLSHYVEWSWWWVTAPLWGGAVAVATMWLVGTLLYAIGKRLE